MKTKARMTKKIKGQATVEYFAILLTVILATCALLGGGLALLNQIRGNVNAFCTTAQDELTQNNPDER